MQRVDMPPAVSGMSIPFCLISSLGKEEVYLINPHIPYCLPVKGIIPYFRQKAGEGTKVSGI